MNKLLSCHYNMDTNQVEARFEGGTTLTIDCIAVEDEYGNTPEQRAELDWLLYNNAELRRKNYQHVDIVRAVFCFNDCNTFLLAYLTEYHAYILFDLAVNHHPPIFRCKHHMILTSPCRISLNYPRLCYLSFQR